MGKTSKGRLAKLLKSSLLKNKTDETRSVNMGVLRHSLTHSEGDMASRLSQFETLPCSKNRVRLNRRTDSDRVTAPW